MNKNKTVSKVMALGGSIAVAATLGLSAAGAVWAEPTTVPDANPNLNYDSIVVNQYGDFGNPAAVVILPKGQAAAEPGAGWADPSAPFMYALKADDKGLFTGLKEYANGEIPANAYMCAADNGKSAPTFYAGGYGAPQAVQSFTGTTYDKKDKKSKDSSVTLKYGDKDFHALAYINSIAWLPDSVTVDRISLVKAAQEKLTGVLDADSSSYEYYNAHKAEVDKLIDFARSQAGPYKLAWDQSKPYQVDGKTRVDVKNLRIVNEETGKGIDLRGYEQKDGQSGVPISNVMVKAGEGTTIHYDVDMKGTENTDKSFMFTPDVTADGVISKNPITFELQDGKTNLNAELAVYAPTWNVITRDPLNTFGQQVDGKPAYPANLVMKTGAQRLFHLGGAMGLTASLSADHKPGTPEIKTNATVGTDKAKTVLPGKDIVVDDEVTFKGLKPGVEYTLSGTLHLFDAKGAEVTEQYVPNAADVSKTVTFKPEKAEGSTIVNIKFPAAGLKPGMKIVAFERLYEGKDTNVKPVAVHEDKTDKNQTISIKTTKPTIDTNAWVKTDDLSNTSTKVIKLAKEGEQQKAVTVVDKVTYANVIPGESYSLYGEIRVLEKAEGDGNYKDITEGFKANGLELKQTRDFQAKEANGFENLEFNIPANLIKADRKFVVTETLHYGSLDGEIVAEHKDLTDEDQTVTVESTPKAPGKPGQPGQPATPGQPGQPGQPVLPKTGIAAGILGGLAGLAGLGGGSYALWRRKNSELQ